MNVRPRSGGIDRDETYRLRLGAKGRRRGFYRVTLRAQRPGAAATTTLSARKL